MRYALVPGAGIADAVREGYAINMRERVVPGDRAVEPVVQVTSGSAVITAVKLADDRSGGVVIRLYESTGGRSASTIRTGFDFGAVDEADLLERSIAPDAVVAAANGSVALNLRPFQIVTLRFRS